MSVIHSVAWNFLVIPISGVVLCLGYCLEVCDILYDVIVELIHLCCMENVIVNIGE